MFFLFLCPFYVFPQAFRSEIISDISHIQIKGSKLVVTDSVVMQINERMGDHDATIYIHYSKGDKIDIGDAWIEDMHGNIVRKLKKNEIKDRSSISDIALYEDDFVKYFEMKHNIYPYRIVYSYKATYSKFLTLISLDFTNRRRPVNRGKVIIEAPEATPIKYKQKNVEEPLITSDMGVTRYQWDYKYIPPKFIELNNLLNPINAPIIKVVPFEFKYGEKGSFESWQSFGNWVYRLNAGRDLLTQNEKIKINDLIKGIDSQQEKAKILYRYLQDYTRYINVSINIGGLLTYPASYVCENKYGDCKALTNYMQSMLKYVGIKSYYTLINASNKVNDVDREFPSQAFNHVILTIPFGTDTTYLECTSKNMPFGYIHTSIQGRKALLVDEQMSKLVTIPSLNAPDVLCTRTIQADLHNSEIVLDISEQGSQYELSNYLTTEVNKNEVDKYIRKNILSGSYDIINFEFKEKPRDKAEIELNVKCKMHNLYRLYGNNLILDLFSLPLATYESPDKRVSGVQLDYPEYHKDKIIYKLDGKNILKLPSDLKIESPFGNYSVIFKYENGMLEINKELLINKGRYSRNVYEDFYNFILSVKNNETKNIYLEVL